MDALMRTALVGTARQPDAGIATDTAIDGITGALDGASAERRILLTAGALAIYRLAGSIPAMAPAPPAVCPAEPRPACPPAAAHLLATLFGSSRAVLLPEALGALARAGHVLPHELLLQALNVREAYLRAAMRPVLGERGRWLARQHPAWEWAAAEPTDDLPPDAEQVWQEGTPAERQEVFRRLRLADPAGARAWLAAVWSSEKSEMRCDLLDLLAVNLSADDEAALERALADGAASVRSVARPLSAKLTQSAFARRMLQRADSLLTFDGGRLRLALPRRLDDAWKRDGIQEQPPRGLGKGAWWAMQVLSLVPPAHWQAKAQREPADLLAALPADDAPLVVESWSRAAILHEDAAWASPLWDWWRQQTGPRQSAPVADNLVTLLFARMPQEGAERRVLHELTEQPTGWEDRLPTMLARLPAPWSEPVACAYLDGLRGRLARLTSTSQDWSDPFLVTVESAALAIAPQQIPLALEPVTLPATASYIVRHWSDRLAAFAETLALRQRIRQEIPG